MFMISFALWSKEFYGHNIIKKENQSASKIAALYQSFIVIFEKVSTAQDKVHLLAVPTIYFLCYEDFLQCISNRFSNLDSPKKQNVAVFKYKIRKWK